MFEFFFLCLLCIRRMGYCDFFSKLFIILIVDAFAQFNILSYITKVTHFLFSFSHWHISCIMEERLSGVFLMTECIQ